MKPGEEMHSAMEEVEPDPCEWFLDVGALLMEGRTPGLSEKGYGEGPHCPPASQHSRPHQCDPNVAECQRYEQIQKHMLLLWKNGIPMSIEVLLYPGCCMGSAPVQNIDASSLPETSCLLLEQWTIHMLPRRVPDANITPRGLMQAVRSFLYFSQLCAWLSLSGGKAPRNIHYRVCVPGEAFSSKFSVSPDTHIFPIANVGRNSAMKIQVKSYPRCGEIPTIFCPQHLTPSYSPKIQKQSMKASTLEKLPEELFSEDDDEYICDGIVPLSTHTQLQPRTSSPADSMLGDSLLDPPPSLAMYPKRYQSPSRCGSPSLEVPEHLMFGKGAITKREAQKQRLKQDVQNRSRPQRRTVAEQALEKSYEDARASSYSDKSQVPDKWLSHFGDILKIPGRSYSDMKYENQASYFSFDDIRSVPKAEMETVLHRLRNRCANTKKLHKEAQTSYLSYSEKYKYMNQTVSVTKCFQNMKISPHNPKDVSTFCDSNISPSSDKATSEDRFIQRINVRKPTSEKVQESNTSHHKNEQSTPLSHKECGSSITKPYRKIDLSQSCVLQDVKNTHYHNHHRNSLKDNSQNHSDIERFPSKSDYLHSYSTIKTCDQNSQNAYHEKLSTNSYKDCNQPSSVNIKKYSGLLQQNSNNYKLTDEREITECHDKTEISYEFLKSDFSAVDEGDLQYHVIPSAEEKAKFRRSLDSATSLVFHKKSGLPLTSSPAPIRKSGTCFDFDSSLTTVSAIKRALFEKQPEDEESGKQKKLPVSYSAPASITVSSLLGTFEESVLNGRLEPVSTVEGFTAEIGASGSFCPRHITLPVTVFFYTLQETDKVTSPYLGHINLGKKEYHVPRQGTVQVTLFNPHRTVVKMYVVRYDLCDMPPNCQTFLRQRTLYMPSDASENDPEAQKWLRYLIHLRFASSKSGRIYLHTDVRVIIFRKSDLDAAAVHGQRPYELRSFSNCPNNPKYSPRRP